MRKSFLKAAIPTMAMLLVAVMALTGTTYAWFTNQDNATVDAIDIKVTSASALRVATKINTGYSGWLSTLTWSHIDESDGVVKPSLTSLEAVSTIASVDGTSHGFTFYRANPATSSGYIKDLDNNTTGKYYKFDLYIWNDASSPKTVSLDGTTVTGKTSADLSQLAVRIGMIEQGIKTGYNADNGNVPEINNASAANSCAIFEPNATTHIDTSLTTKQSYNGLKGTTTGPITTTDSSYTAAVTTETDPKNVKVTIPGFAVKKVTIYIWLEGQDCDCINAITSDTFTVNLVLKAN